MLARVVVCSLGLRVGVLIFIHWLGCVTSWWGGEFSSYKAGGFRYLQKECVRRGTVLTSDLKTCLAAEFDGSQHCAAAFSLQVQKSYTHLNPTFLYISILRTYTKFVRKNKMIAHGVCFPQPCSSDLRKFAASRSSLNNYRTIGSFPQTRIRWNAL